jgi:hypothetical protein
MTALSTTISNNTITMPIVSVSMYSGRTQTEKDITMSSDIVTQADQEYLN